MSSRIRMYLTICLKMRCMWPTPDWGCDIHTEALTLHTCLPPDPALTTHIHWYSPVWSEPRLQQTGLARPWHTRPSVIPGMISRGILLCSLFHTTSLASSTCLEPPWVLHSAASFQLTVDSVIEPKRGACSHCLRTCRSGETFLQVRKRKKKKRRRNRHSLSYFSLSFLNYSTHPFMCPLCARYYVPGISLVAEMIKNLPAMKETWVWSLDRKGPLEEEWQPTPVFLSGEFHGQRSLTGYSPCGHKELDMTKWRTCAKYCAKDWLAVQRWYFLKDLQLAGEERHTE